MALNIEHVQPGELIASSLWNEVADALDQLDVRVAKLEAAGVSGGIVEIDAVSSSPVHVGQNVTIVGKNFQYSIGATRVRFDGVAPDQFQQGSNDTVLICQVPDLGKEIPDNGLTVTLVVSNSQTSAVAELIVLPREVVQAGNADINFVGASPDPVLGDRDVDFEFDLQSDATLAAKMTLTPTIVGPTGAALGWPMTLLDATKKPIESNQLNLGSLATLGFYLRVSIPSLTTGTKFTMRVDAVGGGLKASSGDMQMAVGQVVTPDPAIKDISPTVVNNGTLDGSKLTVAESQFANVSMEADFTTAATYDVSLALAAGTTGWTFALNTPPDAKVIVAEGEIHAGVAKKSIELAASPGANASSPGQLVVTCQREGQTSKRVYVFDLIATTP